MVAIIDDEHIYPVVDADHLEVQFRGAAQPLGVIVAQRHLSPQHAIAPVDDLRRNRRCP